MGAAQNTQAGIRNYGERVDVAPPSRRLSGGRPRPPRRGRDALGTAGKMSSLRNSTEDEEGGTNHALVAERRHEKARHGSAGKAKVEQIESASADDTSFVTASRCRRYGPKLLVVARGGG